MWQRQLVVANNLLLTQKSNMKNDVSLWLLSFFFLLYALILLNFCKHTQGCSRQRRHRHDAFAIFSSSKLRTYKLQDGYNVHEHSILNLD